MKIRVNIDDALAERLRTVADHQGKTVDTVISQSLSLTLFLDECGSDQMMVRLPNGKWRAVVGGS